MQQDLGQKPKMEYVPKSRTVDIEKKTKVINLENQETEVSAPVNRVESIQNAKGKEVIVANPAPNPHDGAGCSYVNDALIQFNYVNLDQNQVTLEAAQVHDHVGNKPYSVPYVVEEISKSDTVIYAKPANINAISSLAITPDKVVAVVSNDSPVRSASAQGNIVSYPILGFVAIPDQNLVQQLEANVEYISVGEGNSIPPNLLHNANITG